MSSSNFESSSAALAAFATALLLLAGCGDSGDDASCEAGYQDQGGSCVDRDECAEGTHTCTGNATCVNRPGAFSCACPAGWVSSGGGCLLSSCRYHYREGHGDLYVSWSEQDGLSTALRSELEPGTGEQLYATNDVCIDVPLVSYRELEELGGRPPGAEWDPIGVAEGEPFWYLPEVAMEGRPWFGLASEPSALGGVPIARFGPTLTLDVQVRPPPGGHLSMWTSGPVGDAYFQLSTVTGAARATLITGSHAHVSWGFTAPGEYLVDATVSGTRTDNGQTVTSASRLLRFVVHDQDEALQAQAQATSDAPTPSPSR
jgi:surface-anchored protein